MTTRTVSFIDVGSEKKSWTEDLPDLDYQTLFKAIKRRHALGSRGIDFDWDEETQQGVIYVGGFRAVGRFEIKDRYVATVALAEAG